ncbi:MAG: creatininase family protein [Planctomycetota bacterium]
MHHLAKLTWPEARARFGPRLVALLPVGATEAHGPHLPLDTDVTIAGAQALRAAQKLGELGVDALVLPPIAYTVAQFAFSFTGTITVRPGTLWNLVEDVVESLQQHAVERVVLCNAHLEPKHLSVLKGVCLDHAARGVGKAQLLFPDVTRRRFAATLGDEFMSGECHAGRYESSIVLAEDEAHVRNDERARLAPKVVGLVEKLRAGAVSFESIGADAAWCGDPASATASEGRELIDRLADIIVTVVREEWTDLFP